MEKPKIVTVTLNPAIDTVYQLEQVEIGSVVRTKSPLKSAGGKGLNVTRVASQLGEKVAATGFVGGHTGQFIRQEVEKLGANDWFVQIDGETRQCLAFIDQAGNQTEILEEGPVITLDKQERFMNQLADLLIDARILVISGSLPKGVCADFYKKIIQEAKNRNIMVILDTSGDMLKDCIDAKPFMIKPNRQELEGILQRSITSETKIWESMKEMHRKGIELVVVSDGSNGSYAVYQNNCYKVSTASIAAKSAVGSGDAFVAGAATGLARSLPIEEVLTLASACGAANALEYRTGYVDLDNVFECQAFTQIKFYSDN